MIIKHKKIDHTTKVLWILTTIISFGFSVILALFVGSYLVISISDGEYARPGGTQDLLFNILYVIGPPLLVILAIFRERIGGLLLVIGSLAFIIWFLIAIDSGKWVAFALGGPFLVYGILFLICDSRAKKLIAKDSAVK